MAKINPGAEYPPEWCASCNDEQPHEISIRFLTESAKDENREFSREPYRVAECRWCGSETKIRLNNA